MGSIPRDELLVDLIMAPVRKCAEYKPAFGLEASDEPSIDQFRRVYGSDPLYHWIGLDTDLMFSAHKAAGGITSVYRQLGIGCERLFREITKQSLGISDRDILWSYEDVNDSGKSQTLTLDALIDVERLNDPESAERVMEWLVRVGEFLGVSIVDRGIRGAVFEVRQGYKSADSKRQNADLRSGTRALASGYLPVVTVFSSQINWAVVKRYRAAGLLVLVGVMEGPDTLSTFQFMRDVVGYDLAQFFDRNSEVLRGEFTSIVSELLKSQ